MHCEAGAWRMPPNTPADIILINPGYVILIDRVIGINLRRRPTPLTLITVSCSSPYLLIHLVLIVTFTDSATFVRCTVKEGPSVHNYLVNKRRKVGKSARGQSDNARTQLQTYLTHLCLRVAI